MWDYMDGFYFIYGDLTSQRGRKYVLVVVLLNSLFGQGVDSQGE